MALNPESRTSNSKKKNLLSHGLVLLLLAMAGFPVALPELFFFGSPTPQDAIQMRSQVP